MASSLWSMAASCGRSVRCFPGRQAPQFTRLCSTAPYVEVERHRETGVGIVTLSRPKALNALCDELCTQLVEALTDCGKDPDLRALVLTGSGKAFAAGADIKQMKSRTFDDVTRTDMLAGWSDIQRIRKPIIAAVNGYALGGGCELAMMCDIIIAADTAKFGQPEILIGTVPGMGGSQRLARAVGKSRAMEWILTGRQVDAAEALQSGLVSRVVPLDRLVDEARKMAEQIASFSLPAIVACKECVNRSFELPLQEGLLFERRLFHSTFATDDQKEGMAAFAEKRSPQWSHR